MCLLRPQKFCSANHSMLHDAWSFEVETSARCIYYSLHYHVGSIKVLAGLEKFFTPHVLIVSRCTNDGLRTWSRRHLRVRSHGLLRILKNIHSVFFVWYVIIVIMIRCCSLSVSVLIVN